MQSLKLGGHTLNFQAMEKPQVQLINMPDKSIAYSFLPKVGLLQPLICYFYPETISHASTIVNIGKLMIKKLGGETIGYTGLDAGSFESTPYVTLKHIAKIKEDQGTLHILAMGSITEATTVCMNSNSGQDELFINFMKNMASGTESTNPEPVQYKSITQISINKDLNIGFSELVLRQIPEGWSVTKIEVSLIPKSKTEILASDRANVEFFDTNKKITNSFYSKIDNGVTTLDLEGVTEAESLNISGIVKEKKISAQIPVSDYHFFGDYHTELFDFLKTASKEDSLIQKMYFPSLDTNQLLDVTYRVPAVNKETLSLSMDMGPLKNILGSYDTDGFISSKIDMGQVEISTLRLYAKGTLN